jgi:mRNA interferase MazF
MSKPTLIYKQFEVVIVPFPFTDTTATKRRPALVLSDSAAFNTSVGRSVMAMITTATHSPWALDIPISDLSSTGLKVASIVRMKLFTIDHRLVVKRIGKLAESDRTAVEQVLKQLFNLV